MEAEHFYCPNCTDANYEWEYVGLIRAYCAQGEEAIRKVYQCPNCKVLCFDWELDSPCAGCNGAPECNKCSD